MTSPRRGGPAVAAVPRLLSWRRLMVVVVVAGAWGLSSCESPNHTLVVTTAADGGDAAPGDGTCEMTAGGGDCSLRAAIDESNASADVELVTIAPGIDPTITLAGPGDDANVSGDLDIVDGLTVDGGGAVISGAGLDRILDVRPNATEPPWVTIEHVTLADGDVSDDGGALRVAGPASVTVTASTITSSHADRHGGGVAVLGGGSLSFNHSTISGTDAGAMGGAVASTGTLSLFHATVADSITGNGGAVRRAVAATGPLNVTASVIDAQASMDCSGAITSGGYNVASDNTCGLTATGDVPAVDPQLAPIADNGGPTPTHRPADTSPVLDLMAPAAAGCGTLNAYDQRGRARVGACDAGAVELAQPLDLSVTDAGDSVDALPGDGRCRDASQQCTLRAAVIEANAWVPERPGTDTVSLPVGLPPIVLSLAGAGEDGALTGDLDLVDDLELHGNGGTVDGNGTSRGFDVIGATEVWIDGLTVRNGVGEVSGLVPTSTTWPPSSVLPPPQQGSGGGISAAADSSLHLDDVTIMANAATDGGGISSAGSVELVSSVIQDNDATASGGGVGADHLVIVDSTVAGNSAVGAGGGVLANVLTVDGSAIENNVAAGGGGGFVYGPADITDSLMSGNQSNAVGAIRVQGPSTFTNTVVSDNSAAVLDGAIYAHGPSVLTGVVLEGNSAPQCAGGYFRDAAFDRSLITGNVATTHGGGFCGNAALTNTTLSGNTAATMSTFSGTAQMHHVTIVSDGSGSAVDGGDDSATATVILNEGGPACSSGLTSLGDNLSSDATCGFTATGDQQNADPLLGPLQDNGGPTLTHLPAAGSPALDTIPAGTNGCGTTITVDQRGFPRPVGGSCDKGAVER